jgi:hypothetical protein
MSTLDLERMRGFGLLEDPYVSFLPVLDPYIMGYRDRRRFLDAAHQASVFDRAGNAVPTVWVNGRIVGVWGQRKDGSVTSGLFESLGEKEQWLLAAELNRLEDHVHGELLPTRIHTPYTRALL